MTATSHSLTGAVIALAIKQPLLAIPLALLSHFICDMIPHFDSGASNQKIARLAIAVDCAVAGTATLLLSFVLDLGVPHWQIFLCMFAAMSPDLVWGWRYYRLKDLKKVISEPMSRFSNKHQKIQWSETPQGLAVDLAWSATMVILIARLAQG